MAQAFYGCTSGTIHVYGMKSKGEFYKVYQDHIKEVGIPHTYVETTPRNREAVTRVTIW